MTEYSNEMLWWRDLLERLVKREGLTSVEAMEATSKVFKYLEDEREEAILIIASFFGALSCKGMFEDELLGMVQGMDSSRKIHFKFARKEPMVTSGGGGGDTLKTINVTTPSFVVASAGGAVTLKSAGRAASYSSITGSADLASTMGVNLKMSKEVVERCVNEIGTVIWSSSLCYPWLDPIFELRERVISPMLFPLMTSFRLMIAAGVNPFGVKRHFRGITSGSTEMIARVLGRMDHERALVVMGYGSTESIVIDEVSNIGKTVISELIGGKVETYEVEPQDFGIPKGAAAEVQAGNSHQENVEVVLRILSGKDRTSRKDLVVVNAASILYLGEVVKSFREGSELASNIINEGLAVEKLRELVQISGGELRKLEGLLSKV